MSEINPDRVRAALDQFQPDDFTPDARQLFTLTLHGMIQTGGQHFEHAGARAFRVFLEDLDRCGKLEPLMVAIGVEDDVRPRRAKRRSVRRFGGVPPRTEGPREAAI